MLGGAAPVSGGFPVAAQPPLAGYPAPGSGSSASAGGVDPAATAYPYAGPDPGAPYAGAPYPAQPYPAPFPTQPYPGTYLAQPYPGTPYPAPPHPGGFPVPPYSGGYPGLSYPAGPARPGTITAAAVLAFVTAGLDLVGGLGAFGATDEGTGMGDWRSQYLWLAGVAALVAGGLLIAGGVQMFRSRVGLLLAGAIATAADALYWLVAFGFYGSSGLDGEVLGTYAVIFLALAVLMVALAYSTSAQRWRSAGAWYGAGPGRAAAPAHR